MLHCLLEYRMFIQMKDNGTEAQAIVVNVNVRLLVCNEFTLKHCEENKDNWKRNFLLALEVRGARANVYARNILEWKKYKKWRKSNIDTYQQNLLKKFKKYSESIEKQKKKN